MNQEAEWEKVEADNDIWNAENIGATIQGIYKLKEENVGNWNKNRYTLLVEDEEGREKEMYVYGTTGLDDLFKNVPIGFEVKIIFKDEIPQKPPKKAFKVFEMFKRPVGVQLKDDPEARVTIDIIRKEVGANATAEEIVKFAEDNQEDLDLEDNDITRIKAQLALEMKEGK